MGRALVIGANGQIGSELVNVLAGRDGVENVIAADVVLPLKPHPVQFEALDVLDVRRLTEIVTHHGIDEVYQLAAMLSATGEASPLRAWTLNTSGLLNVLERSFLCAECRVFEFVEESFAKRVARQLARRLALTDPDFCFRHFLSLTLPS